MSAIAELSQARRGRDESRDNKAAYLFLLPWLVGLVVITIGPMVASLYLSFTDYNLLSAPHWIGLQNYVAMYHDARLINSLKVTFTYVFVSVPLQLALALIIALLLNQGMRGLPFYRSVFYLPSLMGSSVAIAVLWRELFGTTGLVNQILIKLGVQQPAGLDRRPIDGAVDDHLVAHLDVRLADDHLPRRACGRSPTMYYEAAAVDGANEWTRFWHITMPLLSPIMFFNLVLQIIGAFQSFTQAFVVSGGTGGPSDSTMFYTLYLYLQGFGQFRMGYASAMAWLLMIIVALFTAVNFLVSKYWVHYDD